ncbi:MAG: stage IV sporulation protein A [Tyzzerella sp.]|uniref:Stage IV sporulation protein A n=1 Tax=Candidatus Fimicola merdigallinarum TaxID=2840819 RepID=A0A9D9H0S2_9FIRM|nr:stage IV sporulation protein A [Candidatus Fimicola merdigallinarum]
MEQFDIYKDIAERTGGDIYFGIVGPVRTGKSTFIKRFMELYVLPNIDNTYTKDRARDELPQSSAGRTIMTTEPKFVPNEAIEVDINDNTKFKVRLIDCVGYIVPGSEGYLDGDEPRMVNTPWSENPMPFTQAAEIGTKKVIAEHSTIGIVITTDGTVTDIPKENYEEAEERVISELLDLKKPFVVLLNSAKPYAEATREMADSMKEKYGVPVIPVNCASLKSEDIKDIIENILYEFPIREIKMNIPTWVQSLNEEHWLKSEIINNVRGLMSGINKLRDIKSFAENFGNNEYVKKSYINSIEAGKGTADIDIALDDSLFYKILSETTGMEIEDDCQLISNIKMLSDIKKEYDKIEQALSDVKRKGYGIVSPVFEDIKLEKPEVFKQGQRFGIKLKAKGESIHMVKADIETEVSPIIGSEEQSKEFIDNILKEYDESPEKIWELNIFGRTLNSMVNEGLQNKIYRMPEDAQNKLQETLQKIVNEGSGGLICIIL